MTESGEQVHNGPVDFYNSEVIMRCLRMLSIAISKARTNDLRLTDESDGLPYEIRHDERDGKVSVPRYLVYLHGSEGAIALNLWIPYNSLNRHPLHCTIGGKDFCILHEDGTFALKFHHIRSLKLPIFGEQDDWRSVVGKCNRLRIASQCFGSVEMTLRSIGPASISEVIQDLEGRVVGFQASEPEIKAYLVQDLLAILREQGAIDMNEATEWGDENRYVIGLKDYDISRFFWIPAQIVVGVERVLQSLNAGSPATAAIVEELLKRVYGFEDLFSYEDQALKLVEGILSMMQNLELVDSEFADDETFWKLTIGKQS